MNAPTDDTATLHPARWWYYQLPDQPTTEVSRYMTVGEDVYVSMQEVDSFQEGASVPAGKPDPALGDVEGQQRATRRQECLEGLEIVTDGQGV